MLEAHEQPDSIMALSMSNAAARPRIRLSSRPGHIEIAQLFPDKPTVNRPYTKQTVAAPRRCVRP
jgi:hypothetical protein